MKILSALLLVSFLLMPVFQGYQWGEDQDILKFEENDSLEEIRRKIIHNNYNFTVEHNRVFDMSPEEKRAFHSRRPPVDRSNAPQYYDIGPLGEHLGKKTLPSSFDWRDYNGHSYIGAVRDQGSCGSCYSFGANAAAEG
ncbi:MAG: hypothetical protein GY757_59770, partial [bacterium]|nr:hypothetical protein [bacterium]